MITGCSSVAFLSFEKRAKKLFFSLGFSGDSISGSMTGLVIFFSGSVICPGCSPMPDTASAGSNDSSISDIGSVAGPGIVSDTGSGICSDIGSGTGSGIGSATGSDTGAGSGSCICSDIDSGTASGFGSAENEPIGSMITSFICSTSGSFSVFLFSKKELSLSLLGLRLNSLSSMPQSKTASFVL